MRKKKTSKKRLTLYKGNKLNGSQSLEGKNAPKVSRSPSPPVKTNRIKKERLFPEGLPLTVTHPHFAKQAYGWDPSLVTYGSNNVLIWQCEVCEVTWDAMPLERTVRGTKVFCPKCPRIKRGSKSLAEEFPEIALEADGWDPSLIYSHSDLILSWRCSTCRNPWPARVANRTRDLRSGCPWCLTKGKMPLSFSYPEIASEAYGWNSNKVTQYGDGELEWKCNKCGNIWSDTLTNRTVHGYECEKCGKNTRPVWLEHNGQRFRKANDDNRLSVLFPELLKELVDKEIGELASYGAELKVDWKCSVCGHPWPAEIRSRTQHETGCPSCSNKGFSANEPAYLYWVQGINNSINFTQFGISWEVKKRLQRHKQNGFKNHIDLFILYFETGQDALNLETEIKRKLTKIGIPSVKEDKELKTSFDGYTESFRTELLPSKDLKDLLKKLNLDIPKDIKHAWVPTPS